MSSEAASLLWRLKLLAHAASPLSITEARTEGAGESCVGLCGSLLRYLAMHISIMGHNRYELHPSEEIRITICNSTWVLTIHPNKGNSDVCGGLSFMLFNSKPHIAGFVGVLAVMVGSS